MTDSCYYLYNRVKQCFCIFIQTSFLILCLVRAVFYLPIIPSPISSPKELFFSSPAAEIHTDFFPFFWHQRIRSVYVLKNFFKSAFSLHFLFLHSNRTETSGTCQVSFSQVFTTLTVSLANFSPIPSNKTCQAATQSSLHAFRKYY